MRAKLPHFPDSPEGVVLALAYLVAQSGRGFLFPKTAFRKPRLGCTLAHERTAAPQFPRNGRRP
jgi:hypothetical protein